MIFIILAPFFFNGACQTNRSASGTHEKPEATTESYIRHGDILMRSVQVWPKDEEDTRNTLETAKAFKVDKILWIYENSAGFNQQVRDAGIGIGTTMNQNARELWIDSLSRSEALAFVDRYTIRKLDGASSLARAYAKVYEWFCHALSARPV